MNNDIKAVVLDVDGILVGHKGGPNFPAPCPEIIDALRSIKAAGIPVILCTGRPFYTPAMELIVNVADLNNFHIGEMGCLTMNPISGKILRCQTVSQGDCHRLVHQLLEENIVTNYFTPEKYFVQKNQADDEISILLAASVEAHPVEVESLEDNIKNLPILYVSGNSKKESARFAMENIYKNFSGKFNLLWGNNLFLADYHYGFFVPSGTSKSASLINLLGHIGISFENVLGAGDGIVDWDFMKFCGYRATLENALPEVLKNMRATNDPARNFIGPGVDQNGILAAFRHFGLI